MGNKAGGKGKKDPTILTDDDIKELKLNTQYTEEEIQAWHTGFLKDCPSGKLDKKQFLNVYKVRRQLNKTKHFLALFFVEILSRRESG